MVVISGCGPCTCMTRSVRAGSGSFRGETTCRLKKEYAYKTLVSISVLAFRLLTTTTTSTAIKKHHHQTTNTTPQQNRCNVQYSARSNPGMQNTIELRRSSLTSKMRAKCVKCRLECAVQLWDAKHSKNLGTRDSKMHSSTYYAYVCQCLSLRICRCLVLRYCICICVHVYTPACVYLEHLHWHMYMHYGFTEMCKTCMSKYHVISYYAIIVFQPLGCSSTLCQTWPCQHACWSFPTQLLHPCCPIGQFSWVEECWK